MSTGVTKLKDNFVSAVRFPDSPPCHSDGLAVHFTAVTGGRSIRCAISLDALADHFEKDRSNPVAAFSRNRAAIERIAGRLIAQRRFENNGSILIRSFDC